MAPRKKTGPAAPARVQPRQDQPAKRGRKAAASGPIQPNTGRKIATPATTQSRKSAVAKKDASKPQPAVTAKSKAQISATSSKQTAGTKRKIRHDDQDEAAATAKKPRGQELSAPKPPAREQTAPKPPKPRKALPLINHAPSQRLNVYCMGSNEMGELGLGTDQYAQDVNLLRLNPFLPAAQVGVVQLAIGGMHCLALSQDNRIFSWGVNDEGALGRDVEYNVGEMVQIPKGDTTVEMDDDNGNNPREVSPFPIPSEFFPEGTIFTQIAAGDSCSFALTNEGLVYGWGTFKTEQGDPAFSETAKNQWRPALIPGLKNITKVVCGANHALALDNKGKAFIWGRDDKSQLGRRHVARHAHASLKPVEFGLQGKGIKDIGTGSYHSFAIDRKNDVWAWGNNAMCQCADPEGKGVSDTTINSVRRIENLSSYNFKSITGGMNHSIGITEKDECVVWGSATNGAIGVDLKTVSKDNVIAKEGGDVGIVFKPTKVSKVGNVVSVAAGGDTSMAVNHKGEAWAWGSNTSAQTGINDDSVNTVWEPRNPGMKKSAQGAHFNWSGLGGQCAFVTAAAD